MYKELKLIPTDAGWVFINKSEHINDGVEKRWKDQQRDIINLLPRRDSLGKITEKITREDLRQKIHALDVQRTFGSEYISIPVDITCHFSATDAEEIWFTQQQSKQK